MKKRNSKVSRFRGSKVLWLGVMVLAGMLWVTGCKTQEQVVKGKIINQEQIIKKRESKIIKEKMGFKKEVVFEREWGDGTNQIPLGIYTNEKKVVIKWAPKFFYIDKSRNYYIHDSVNLRIVKYSNNKIVSSYKYEYFPSNYFIPYMLYLNNKNELFLFNTDCPLIMYKYKSDGKLIDKYMKSCLERYKEEPYTNKKGKKLKDSKGKVIKDWKELNWCSRFKKKYNYKYKIIRNSKLASTIEHWYKIKNFNSHFITTNYYKAPDAFILPVLKFIDSKGYLYLAYKQDISLFEGKPLSMYKEDCALYFLIYNKYGKLIAELPIKKYGDNIQGSPRNVGDRIFIDEDGNIYDLYADGKGFKIIKYRLE